MSAYFVSDIHLSTARPDIVEAFIAFLDGKARDAGTLYILGDCFDQYLGDDDHTEPHPRTIRSLRRLTDAGVKVEVIQGNHDFLLGPGFETGSGCSVLPDTAVIDLYGTRVLIMHGDTLCTDDVDYQEFRRYTRNAENQQAFLALPLENRRAEAKRVRASARDQTRLKPEEIMDVNPAAVAAVMREQRVSHLIHGHTHRPAVHEVDLGSTVGIRIVLADWYDEGSVLVWDREGPRRVGLREL